MELSKRQRAIQRFAEQNGTEPRAWGNTSRPARSMEKLRRDHLLDVRAHRLLGNSPKSKPKPKPLSPELEARARRLGIFKSELDGEIDQQIATQPKKHHAALRKLYDAWSYSNAAFFGGELKTPIILIERTKHGLANCTITGPPTIIRFHPDTITEYAGSLVDIVIHESIHQYLGEKYTDAKFHRGNDGHHQQFAAICNHISKARGWPQVTHQLVDGPTAAKYWPPRIHAKAWK